MSMETLLGTTGSGEDNAIHTKAAEGKMFLEFEVFMGVKMASKFLPWCSWSISQKVLKPLQAWYLEGLGYKK